MKCWFLTAKEHGYRWRTRDVSGNPVVNYFTICSSQDPTSPAFVVMFIALRWCFVIAWNRKVKP